MNLEEKFALNIQFPIRLAMLKHSIRLNLDFAKTRLKKNKLPSARIAVKFAEEDIKDLEYYFKKTSLREQKIEFTKIKNDIRDLQCCQRAKESFP